jgi:hypothetical protein
LSSDKLKTGGPAFKLFRVQRYPMVRNQVVIPIVAEHGTLRSDTRTGLKIDSAGSTG